MHTLFKMRVPNFTLLSWNMSVAVSRELVYPAISYLMQTCSCKSWNTSFSMLDGIYDFCFRPVGFLRLLRMRIEFVETTLMVLIYYALLKTCNLKLGRIWESLVKVGDCSSLWEDKGVPISFIKLFFLTLGLNLAHFYIIVGFLLYLRCASVYLSG